MTGDTKQSERSQRGAALLAEQMQAAVAPMRVGAGEVVAHQGDEGRCFYLVGSGALDVVVESEEGLRLPIARLGPGSHFGEMSLLAGMPASADVVASEPSVLYGVAPEEFHRLMRRRPELVEYLASELAIRLKQTNTQLAVQQRRQATLSTLIGSRASFGFESDLPGLRKLMTAGVAEVANSDQPALIVGERGVGKRALALHLHASGPRRAKAVLVVDCRELSLDEARSQLFGDADPEFVTRFSDRLGYLQAADRGTLVLANLSGLPVEVQDDLATFLRAHGEHPDDTRVAVRVIGTVEEPHDTSGGSLGLSDALAQAFASGPEIRLKPLRERRRDIIPLAEHFLREAARLGRRPPKRLGESAKRKLLSHEFRSANLGELRQIVDLGIDLAEGEEIAAQHLFFGAGVGAERSQIDLLRWTRLERLLLRGHLLTGARAFVALVFAGITAACLIAPTSRAGQVANAMAWGLWWPTLVVLSVLLGRVWCAVCPLSSGAEAVQRVSGRHLPPTDRLKDAGPTLALIGFAAIIWLEHATGMVAHPRATAILLLSLAVIAAMLGWLYQRHTWCRYLCPLGAMSAMFSTASSLRVQARREVCQGSCTGNECYKGSGQASGCPMFNHALFLNSGQHCKLCLECLRACPSRSARLVAQFPLRDLWQSDLVSTEIAPLTVVVGLMALLLLAAPTVDSIAPLGGSWLSGGTIAVVAIGLALQRLFRSAERRGDSGRPAWAARVIYAYVPAVAVAMFCFHIRSLPWLDRVFLRLGESSGDLLGASLLQIAEGLAVGLGGAMTLLGLWRLCRQRLGPQLVTPVVAWIPLGLLAAAYVTAGLLLPGRG